MTIFFLLLTLAAFGTGYGWGERRGERKGLARGFEDGKKAGISDGKAQLAADLAGLKQAHAAELDASRKSGAKKRRK